MSSEAPQSQFVEPCKKKSNNSLASSLGSRWLSSSDFGECFVRASNSQLYPCLTPVYNGKILNVKSDLLHESLSAISIKHYYGKCSNEVVQYSTKTENKFDYEFSYGEDFNGYEVFGSEKEVVSSKSSTESEEIKGATPLGSALFADERADEFRQPGHIVPECMKDGMNFRNSFWNLHRPELCKLTWPQNYVSTATLTEHLHQHLISHGPFCAEVHHEEDRINLLNEELANYGKLKMLVSPRNIPPDEKPFNLKKTDNLSTSRCKARIESVRCKGFSIKTSSEEESMFLQLSDDEETVKGKKLGRSKEEFCLTIGRHIRKPSIKKSLSEIDQGSEQEEDRCFGEEESGFFFYNWLTLATEECCDGDTDESTIDLEPVSPSALAEPCPVLGMNDFCRAVAKADFSDLRCHPDDF